MSQDPVPLYVRLSAEPSRRLDQAVSASGKTKRQLVEEAVQEHLRDDGLIVGRISLRDEVPDVLTLEEAAAMLRVTVAELERAAERGEVPGRRIAGAWRFGKAALLEWLGSSVRGAGTAG